jgi:hypothetical protein
VEVGPKTGAEVAAFKKTDRPPQPFSPEKGCFRFAAEKNPNTRPIPPVLANEQDIRGARSIGNG